MLLCVGLLCAASKLGLLRLLRLLRLLPPVCCAMLRSMLRLRWFHSALPARTSAEGWGGPRMLPLLPGAVGLAACCWPRPALRVLRGEPEPGLGLGLLLRCLLALPGRAVACLYTPSWCISCSVETLNALPGLRAAAGPGVGAASCAPLLLGCN